VVREFSAPTKIAHNIHHLMRGTTNSKSTHTSTSLEKCQALILAGCLGTRLRSAFDVGPKSMAPVGGRYFLEYLLDWLRSAGIRELILCVGHKKSQIQNWLDDGREWGLHIRYSVEKKLLGTAGALKLAEKMISGESCFVVNGDSFLGIDLKEMYQFHVKHRSLATIALARVRNSARYGTVQLDRKARIVAFREKSAGASKRGPSSGNLQLINGGVYVLEKQFFDAIPPRKAVSLERDVFPPLVGKNLYGFVTSGYFIDIGVPADFERAQTELPKRFCA